MPNQCTVSGRLGADSELRTTTNGSIMLSFSLACDTGWGDRKKTDWFRCTLWGERGEKLLDYLKKGTQVVALGEVSLNTYQDKEGYDKSNLDLNVRDVWLVGSKPQNQQGATGQRRQTQATDTRRRAAPQQQQVAQQSVPFDDDDVPF